MSEPLGKTFKTGDITYLKVSGNNVVETINDAGDRQNLQTSSQAYQEEKREDPNKQNQKSKRRINNWHHGNTKNYKTLR